MQAVPHERDAEPVAVEGQEFADAKGFHGGSSDGIYNLLIKIRQGLLLSQI
jgi:hypothetical protein